MRTSYKKFFIQLIMFSLPLIIIFVDKKIFKTNFADQWPIIFPPNKTELFEA